MSDTETAILKLRILFANSPMDFYGEAVLLAIDALEKQVPKKAIVEERSTFPECEPIDFIICPTCRLDLCNEIEWEDATDDSKILRFTEDVETENLQYCGRCGQHIDWEVKNE